MSVRLVRASFVDESDHPIKITLRRSAERFALDGVTLTLAMECDGDDADHHILVDVLRPDGEHGGVVVDEHGHIAAKPPALYFPFQFIPLSTGTFLFRLHLDGIQVHALSVDVLDHRQPLGHVN